MDYTKQGGMTMAGKITRERITQPVIDAVKKYLTDPAYENLTLQEIARLSGVSYSTVTRIKAGQYDNANNSTEEISGVTTTIPYEELKRLINYETTVKELISACIVSDVGVNDLFLPRQVFNRTLKRLGPDEVAAQLKLLHEQDIDS